MVIIDKKENRTRFCYNFLFNSVLFVKKSPNLVVNNRLIKWTGKYSDWRGQIY